MGLSVQINFMKIISNQPTTTDLFVNCHGVAYGVEVNRKGDTLIVGHHRHGNKPMDSKKSGITKQKKSQDPLKGMLNEP